ncbi:uncharacterized protein [Macrobrachium rosenbergii]|uniref:uncharacterized protein n=1 Tax=Macrobrachium rosenbergii TaxID=79674 RepID=UPI0034D5A271
MSSQWLLFFLLELLNVTLKLCSCTIRSTDCPQSAKISDITSLKRISETSFSETSEGATQEISKSFREPKMFLPSPEHRTRSVHFLPGSIGFKSAHRILPSLDIDDFHLNWNAGTQRILNPHHAMPLNRKHHVRDKTRASPHRPQQLPQYSRRSGLGFAPQIHPRPSRRPPSTTGEQAVDIPAEVLQLLPGTVRRVYDHYSATTATPTTTTTKPPVIWFPDLSAECEEEEAAASSPSGGGSFNAFTFLAMAVSITNLVSLLASNSNNNINNNNNNNNLNNDNVLDGNEDNNNNNLDLLTMVTFAGRKKRALILPNDTFSDSEGQLTPDPEDVAAGVALLFLRVWYQTTRTMGDAVATDSLGTAPRNVYDVDITSDISTTHGSVSGDEVSADDLNADSGNVFHGIHAANILQKAPGGAIEDSVASKDSNPTRSLTGEGKNGQSPQEGCVLRALCQANKMSTGFGKLGEDIAEVMSAAFVEFLPGWESARWPLSVAGSRGRSGADCLSLYRCSLPGWNGITADEFERHMIHSLPHMY